MSTPGTGNMLLHGRGGGNVTIGANTAEAAMASPLQDTGPLRSLGAVRAANGVSGNAEPIGALAGTGGVIKAGLPYCTLRFGKYKRPQPFSSSDLEYDLYIALPLPNELQDQTGVDYTDQRLETVGDIINGNFNTSAAAAAGLRLSGDLIHGAIGGAANALGKFGAIGTAIGGAIQNAAQTLAPAEQITSAIQQATGAAPNPNPSLMFEGPQLREFTYSWTFMPDNKTESENLRKFITNVKSRVLPRVTQGLSPVLFYPHMVQMNFYPWDSVTQTVSNAANPGGVGANPWGWGENTIIRMKKCVVKSFNINYTPVNVPAFFAGEEGSPHPVAITCTVQLKELEYMLASDWDVRGGFAGNIDVAAARTEVEEVFQGINAGG